MTECLLTNFGIYLYQIEDWLVLITWTEFVIVADSVQMNYDRSYSLICDYQKFTFCVRRHFISPEKRNL